MPDTSGDTKVELLSEVEGRLPKAGLVVTKPRVDITHRHRAKKMRRCMLPATTRELGTIWLVTSPSVLPTNTTLLSSDDRDEIGM